MPSNSAASASSATPTFPEVSVDVDGELTGNWDVLAELARPETATDLFRPASPPMGRNDTLFSHDTDTRSVRLQSPEGGFRPRSNLGRKTVTVAMGDTPQGRQVIVGIVAETYDRDRCPAIAPDGRPLLPKIVFPVALDTDGKPTAVGAPSRLLQGGLVPLTREQVEELTPLVTRGMAQCAEQLAGQLSVAPAVVRSPAAGPGDISRL